MLTKIREMSDKLKTKFQNKCIGLTDEGREYIYGTDWKGYAKALEKEVNGLKDFITGFHWETHGLYAWASGAITDEQKQMIKK